MIANLLAIVETSKSYFMKEIDTETRMTILIALNINDRWNYINLLENKVEISCTDTEIF